jgi:transporter family-2 protein
MNHGVIITLAIFIGGIIAFQGPINSELGKILSHPIQAAIISFTTGTLTVIFAALIFKSGFPTGQTIASAPKVLLLGGVLGCIYIIANILFIPQIGVFKMLISILVGQVVVSLIIDNIGLFGVPRQAINFQRILGASLVIAGIVVINK